MATSVVEFEDGCFVMTVPNKFTKTNRRVISKVILPGITSGGIMKLIQDIATKSMQGI